MAEAMRLLVTGGAGFIGSHFIRLVLETRPGVRVVNLDRRTYASLNGTLDGIVEHPDYSFVPLDVADAAAVDALLATGFDAVVHCAAETHVDRSLLDSGPFVAANIVGTHVLIEAARRHGVRRFVHVSSDEVYGPIPPGAQAGPESPLDPVNPYAASKAAADLLVIAAIRSHRFPAIVTRCTNNYGPWQHPEKLIPRLTIAALSGGELPVYGDGHQVRDWIHVEDHCRALLAVLERGRLGATLTIAGGSSRTNLEVAGRILELAGTNGARIVHVADRPAHDRRYALDDAATRRDLDWLPRHDFTAGLEATVDWYRRHRAWWESPGLSAPTSVVDAGPVWA